MEPTSALMDAAGDIIRRYREVRGMKRPDLARLTGLSIAVIEKYELAGTMPSREAAEKMDVALEANGAVLAACGYIGPEDWGAELATLRAQVAQLDATVRKLAQQVERLLDR